MEARLHGYQEYSVQWILDHPYAGLFLDMGLGKTLTTLTAVSDLLTVGEIEDVLVIAPLKVAEKTWSDEIEKWDHLKHIRYSKILGSPKQREAALKQKADVYLINRENVTWLVEYFKTKWPFKTVVIDELSSFKAPSSKRFKALKKVRPKINRMIGLTGTPAPNNLMDLWSQMYLLDQGERLGRTLTAYRNHYFRPDKMNGHIVYSYQLLPGAEESIYQKIEDICISMKAKDYLNLPSRVDSVIEVELTPSEMQMYQRFERDYVLDMQEDEITAANAAVLSNKLLQLANGAIYNEFHDIYHIHDAKLTALKNIVEDSQGQPLLVFYNFQHDLDRLQAHFPEAEILSTDNMDRWNEGKIPMLLAHPQSAGHGLNLQRGGHIIVWFGLTWSLEYYQQANARLDRQGQTESVIVHHLVAKGTVDEMVLNRLEGKEMTQEELLLALKARVKGVD